MSDGDGSRADDTEAGEASVPDGTTRDPTADDPATDRTGRATATMSEAATAPDDTSPASEPPATGGDGTRTEPLQPSDIDVAELTGPERSLEPAVRLVWILRAAVSALVLGTVVGAVAAVFDLPLWAGPAVFALLFVLGAGRAHLRYESWSYRVRTDSLFLDRGVLTQVRTVVPYVRIQHVDASRGPVERAFGLATVVVYTAGSRGADVTIPGLTPERADDLQERLKRLAIAAEGEDAV